jgi:DNA polymerase III subunit gamma/tau
MSQALYRKWRPARFDDVVGQEHITRTLRQATAANRIGHAYLFCGPRGTGKTTTARLLAKGVNCTDPDLTERPCNQCHCCTTIGQGRFLDLIEIDAASNTGVDDIRDLREKINFSPSEGRYKVYIIDEVHMLSTAAFNALLKTLEEPPPHAIFILATTEEHKVPLTIKSRCQQFNFRLLTTMEIIQRLQWLAEQENLQIEPEALALIAAQGAGSLRDAESLLDQLVTAPDAVISLELAQRVLGIAANAAVTALTQAWLRGDGPAGLAIIHEALSAGADARQFCRQMVVYLRQLLLLHTGGRDLQLPIRDEQKQEMLALVQQTERSALIAAVKRFQEAALTPANSWQPQLPLELAFIELLPGSRTAVSTAVEPVSAQPEQPLAAAVQLVTQPEPQPAQPMPAAPSPVAPPLLGPPAAAGEAQAALPPAAESAPAATPTTAVASVTAASADVLNLPLVISHWREMMRLVSAQNRNLGALLSSAKPLGVEGDVVIIGFDFPLLKQKFDQTPQASNLVAGGLAKALGRPCQLRCVVSGQYLVPKAPAAVAPPPENEPQAGAPLTIDKDAFQALAEELGGVVTEIEE